MRDAPTHVLHGDGPTAAERHAHEQATYDAMAEELLARLGEDELRVRADRIPFANREHVDYLSHAIAALGPLAHRRVLEVGVGGGALASWMALQGADVTGIDVSGGILALAARRAASSGVGERVRLVHAAVEDFDDPDATFDAVIGNNVVHHFERDRAMGNVARLLRPDGRAVFCEPVLFLPGVVRQVRSSELVRRRFPPHTHSPDERSLDRRDLAVIEAHFGSVRWQPFQLLCRLQNFTELSDPTWNRLEAIDRVILRRVPTARWLARMIVLVLERPRVVGRHRERR